MREANKKPDPPGAKSCADSLDTIAGCKANPEMRRSNLTRTSRPRCDSVTHNDRRVPALSEISNTHTWLQVVCSRDACCENAVLVVRLNLDFEDVTSPLRVRAAAVLLARTRVLAESFPDSSSAFLFSFSARPDKVRLEPHTTWRMGVFAPGSAGLFSRQSTLRRKPSNINR